MNKIYTLLLALFVQAVYGQIPAGYYDSANGLTGPALKTALSKIITQGHRDNGYSGLWTAYKTTDIDNFYEKNGTILDIYSERPNGPDAYEYTPGSNQCGNYTKEGECYNREHIVPQSIFNEKPPMVSDVNFIRATDGKVNGIRSNYPFGVVGTPVSSTPTTNGSKLGNSVSPGYAGTVFEPIDAFKGDVARMVFYFVTRYESQLSTFNTNDIITKSAYPGIQKWELDQLLAWAAMDPVSPEEIARNNASYNYQGNRNPYIDHPEYVQAVWGTVAVDSEAPTAPANVAAKNPTGTTMDLSWTAATDNTGVTSYDIYVNGQLTSSVSGSSTTVTISGLSPNTTYNFYVIAKDAAGNSSPQSNTAQGATTNTPPPAGSGSCGTETFENIPASNSSYSTRTWTSNNITWTATDARTDETINGRAITIRNGALQSSAISGGIGSLTVTTQLKYSGSASNLDVYVNDIKVGQIPYNSSVNTKTININVSGNFILKIVNPTNGNRVAIDDLSWTCLSTLSTSNPTSRKTFAIYPNPVRNSEIYIQGLEGRNDVEIYSTAGQLLQTFKNVGDGTVLKLKKLNKGIYLLKAGNNRNKIIIE